MISVKPVLKMILTTGSEVSPPSRMILARIKPDQETGSPITPLIALNSSLMAWHLSQRGVMVRKIPLLALRHSESTVIQPQSWNGTTL